MNKKHPGNLALLCVCFIVLAVLILASVAARSAQGQQASICRIYVDEPSGMRNIGSGALLDLQGDEGLVITCWHLFSDGVKKIVVEFPGIKRHEARLLGVDKDADLAALMISKPVVPTLGLGEFDPGASYRAGGYDYPNGRFRLVRGRLTPTQPDNHFRIYGGAREGDSGGPVLNEQNQIVGVLWGTDGSATFAAKTVRLTTFVGRWGIRPDCPDGKCQQPVVVRPAPSRQIPILLPTPADAPQPACQCNLGAIKARLAYLEQEIEAKDGKPGPPGPPGKDGLTPEINYDLLGAAIDADVLAAKIAALIGHGQQNDGDAETPRLEVFYDLEEVPHPQN